MRYLSENRSPLVHLPNSKPMTNSPQKQHHWGTCDHRHPDTRKRGILPREVQVHPWPWPTRCEASSPITVRRFINVLHVGILQVSKVVTPNGLEMLRSPKDNDNVLLIPNFGCRLPLSVIQLPQGQLVWMLGRRLEPNFEQLQTSTKKVCQWSPWLHDSLIRKFLFRLRIPDFFWASDESPIRDCRCTRRFHARTGNGPLGCFFRWNGL